MSKIDELLQKYCPNGVEYKTLGELGSFYGGITGKSKEDFVDGNATFITYRNVYSNPALDIFPADKVKIGESENQRTLQYGDVIFTGSSETPDECGISSVVTEEVNDDLYLNSFCFFFRFDDLSKIEPSFMKHLFRSNDLRYQIGKTASGVTRYNVSKKLMAKVVIPVPPLEVQREIVQILDEFTLLTAELTAELTARKKQYDYYKSALFDFDENVPVFKIGDFTRVFSASRVHKKDWREEGVPFWRSSDLISYYNGVENSRGKVYISQELYDKLSAKSGKIEKDDILVTGGGTIGVPYVVPSNDPLYVKDADLLCIKKNSTVRTKYLYHYFLSQEFKDYLMGITHDATIAHYTITQIKDTPIPVPSLEEQDRIISILDKFEDITKSISIGLPAEIDARQKQYEYYRDSILSFKREG